ncbi:ABC transporter permease (plasmid) [Rhodococcus pyridinivorans]|nr:MULTISPECIES: ABC transporter permease [Rhodococcus]MCT7293684.1 ABC transporter permease [Rhodococcus sp. PAE-6]UVT27690.1 ABC transporter permease [Rhodococcus pyridinivorans]
MRAAAQVLRTNFTDVVESGLRTFGRAVELAATVVGGSVTDTVRGRFRWKDALQQAWFLVTVTAVPAVLIAIPFGIIVSIQVGNLIEQLGADALLGAAGGMGVIKQGAPMATGFLLGGAGAAAIAADLGARTIREEIDALRTLGIDPVRRLVVPRFVAMVVVAPMLNVLIMAVGILSGYLAAVIGRGVTPGSYWGTFGAFVTTSDIWVSLGKSVVFGFLVVIIASQRGLEAKGGPRGVADGVNASVVLSVASIVLANLAITQILAQLLPPRLA